MAKQSMTERSLKLLSQFLDIGSQPTAETFPELPDLLSWFRFALGLGYGIYLGNQHQTGAVSMLFALNFISFIPMMWCAFFLQANQDTYGSKLLFAGLPNALALTLLVWTYLNTLHYSEEEEKMAALLTLVKESVLRQAETETTLDAMVGESNFEETASAPEPEESEF